jgi:hypothetical protein
MEIRENSKNYAMNQSVEIMEFLRLKVEGLE